MDVAIFYSTFAKGIFFVAEDESKIEVLLSTLDKVEDARNLPIPQLFSCLTSPLANERT